MGDRFPPLLRTFAALLLLLLIAGWGFYLFGLAPFLRSVYDGTSLSYFSEFAADWRARQAHPSFSFFLREAKALLFRFALLSTLFSLLGMGMALVRPIPIRNFFSTPSSPYNLALLRIVTFGVLLGFDLSQAEWYAQFPSLLRVPPPGLDALLAHLPVTADTVSVASVLFRSACIFGLIGLYARTSAIVAVVSGLYVLGVPQFYGKVNHYHHVLWFVSLLAASPCADVLSVDAVRHGWRRSSPAPPSPSRSYGLPLRFLWILLGIIYFFPGFWKLTSEGLSWALSDNLKHRMHTLWFSAESFSPLFRLDQYPLLYQTAGLFTLAFENGFLFCLPFSSLRPLAASAAFAFHELTRLFLNIHFWTLPPFLPFLFDLRAVFIRGGQWIHDSPLILGYDPSSPWEVRVAATLQRFDLLDRLRVTAAPTGKSELAVTGSHDALWVEGRPCSSALSRVIAYVPAAVLLLPLAAVAPLLSPPSPSPRPTPSPWLPTITGAILLLANVACGLGHINSWPFSVYPTFAIRSDTTTRTIQVEAVTQSDSNLVLAGSRDYTALGMASARFRGLTGSILRTESDSIQSAKLHALWVIWEKKLSPSIKVDSVYFYRMTHLVNPDQSDSMLSKSLITGLDVTKPEKGERSPNVPP